MRVLWKCTRTNYTRLLYLCLSWWGFIFCPVLTAAAPHGIVYVMQFRTRHIWDGEADDQDASFSGFRVRIPRINRKRFISRPECACAVCVRAKACARLLLIMKYCQAICPAAKAPKGRAAAVHSVAHSTDRHSHRQTFTANVRACARFVLCRHARAQTHTGCNNVVSCVPRERAEY